MEGKTEMVARIVGLASKLVRQEIFNERKRRTHVPASFDEGVTLRLVTSYKHVGSFYSQSRGYTAIDDVKCSQLRS